MKDINTTGITQQGQPPATEVFSAAASVCNSQHCVDIFIVKIAVLLLSLLLLASAFNPSKCSFVDLMTHHYPVNSSNRARQNTAASL